MNDPSSPWLGCFGWLLPLVMTLVLVNRARVRRPEGAGVGDWRRRRPGFF